MEAVSDTYAFWWLTGKNIIDSLHKTQEYLKNYRSCGSSCLFDKWNKEFYFNSFIHELRSTIEAMAPYLKDKKIEIKIPTNNIFSKWEATYYALVNAMPLVGLTDLKRREDEGGEDEELYTG